MKARCSIYITIAYKQYPFFSAEFLKLYELFSPTLAPSIQIHYNHYKHHNFKEVN